MKPTYKQIQMMKRKYDNNVRLRLNKCSVIKTCEFCGNLYVPNHHNQKFCSDYCYKEHRKDYKAEWKRTKYHPKPIQQLGTSYITEKRNKDFKKEHEILQKEVRRLTRKR